MKEGRKEGVLPVRGLSVLKTDSHGIGHDGWEPYYVGGKKGTSFANL